MTPDITIDARDLLCPLPVLRLRKALLGAAPGAVVHLLATDPMARIDVPHFCAEQGHEVLDTTEEGAVMRFTIRAKP